MRKLYNIGIQQSKIVDMTEMYHTVADGELALDDGHAASSTGGSSSGESTSNSDYDEPPRYRAWTR